MRSLHKPIIGALAALCLATIPTIPSNASGNEEVGKEISGLTCQESPWDWKEEVALDLEATNPSDRIKGKVHSTGAGHEGPRSLKTQK
ncbi:MAG: hypothetical protein M1368_04225 [Thaumarchaeota archaeon]|nr:hypothetical protein [Nitrososphaerota archaeon]